MAEDGTLYKNGESYYTTSPKHHLQRNNSLHEQFCNKFDEQETSIPIKRESKCNSFSSEESADSPLDFSFKRKSIEQESSSGRDSAPSPSSTAETSSFVDERKSSDPEDVPYCNGTLQNGNIVDQKPELGEIRSSRSPGSTPGLERMISAFNAGLVPPSTVLSVFPGMASLLDPRTQNNKSTRPFKTYPKDSLPVPYGAYTLSPGYSPFQGMDPTLLQNLNMSNEELMNLYNRQLNYLRDRNGHKDNSRNMSRSSPSTISSTSSSSATVTTNSIIQNNINHSINGSNFSNGSIKHSQVHISPSSSPGTPPCSSSGITVTSSGRKRPKILPDEQKDEAYWDRRRKNNDAAKRSRDARRAKEDEIAIKAALLEQENLKLRVEVAALKTETAKLRCMLYNS